MLQIVLRGNDHQERIITLIGSFLMFGNRGFDSALGYAKEGGGLDYCKSVVRLEDGYWYDCSDNSKWEFMKVIERKNKI